MISRAMCAALSISNGVFVLFVAPKSGAGAVNANLPPLRFHNIHGENVRLYKNGFVARRVDSFCKGVAFSNRPVAVNEKVYIKFLEISDNWSGVIRFGFTSEDPTNVKKVPKYACPGESKYQILNAILD